jgi:hypothetical protein
MGNEAAAIKRTLLLVVGLAVALVVAVGAFIGFTHKSNAPSWTKPADYNAARPSNVPGGEVRVAVATPPEIEDTGEGGTALRSLVLPRLFDAQPNGTWSPSLVQPGTDGAARNGLTAWFTLRHANWSNGTPITVDDLRRTEDTRFVSSLDGPDARGRITVHLKAKLPGWRMLWSGESEITAPTADLYAGPFVIQSIVSGESTVLSRNAAWFETPLLNTIDLDYVPDSTMARQLLAAGDVDVVAPVADTQRTNLYNAIPGATIATADNGGRWTALKFNSTVANPTYAGVLGAFPRSIFVNSLLPGEANAISGFAVHDNTWTNYGATPNENLSNANVTLTVPMEEPLSSLLATSLQRAVSAGGGKLTVRSTDTATVNGYVDAKTYDLAFVTYQSQPNFCWTCVFGDVDTVLARQADAGDNAAALKLEQQARDGGILLPLWRDKTLIAYRSQLVGGVQANGYSASPVWNAANWWATLTPDQASGPSGSR